jgi:hypothetical protein
MSAVVAAWYRDPLKRHQLRYWDGSHWTHEVSDDGVVGTDPIAVNDALLSAPSATLESESVDFKIAQAAENVCLTLLMRTSDFGASSTKRRIKRAAVRVTDQAIWIDIMVDKLPSLTPTHQVTRVAANDIVDFIESDFSSIDDLRSGTSRRHMTAGRPSARMKATESGIQLRTRHGDLYLMNTNSDGAAEVRKLLAALVDLTSRNAP